MRQLKISKSITNRDSASLDLYLADIARHEMISAEEEAVLARRIREGDQEALEKLTVANLRFVVSVAKQYQNQGLGLIDLINEGNLGLIKAARRFDEKRGFKFISYAVWWIRQCIMQAIAEQSRMIRLPLNKIGALSQIRKARIALEQRLERDASPSEIAEVMGVAEEDVKTAISISAKHVSSDAPFTHNEEMSVMDVAYDPESPLPDNALILSSLSIEIRRALSKLTQRESEVIILHYGLGGSGSLSLEEIAMKYDLTRERVRQIKDKAIRRLRAGTKNVLLQSYLG
ncbi:MAG: RNA polymerase sigma factor RpoD/SigA [Bacteroidota bacterium]